MWQAACVWLAERLCIRAGILPNGILLMCLFSRSGEELPDRSGSNQENTTVSPVLLPLETRNDLVVAYQHTPFNRRSCRLPWAATDLPGYALKREAATSLVLLARKCAKRYAVCSCFWHGTRRSCGCLTPGGVCCKEEHIPVAHSAVRFDDQCALEAISPRAIHLIRERSCSLETRQCDAGERCLCAAARRSIQEEDHTSCVPWSCIGFCRGTRSDENSYVPV
jgi:hypothetical protein